MAVFDGLGQDWPVEFAQRYLTIAARRQQTARLPHDPGLDRTPRVPLTRWEAFLYRTDFYQDVEADGALGVEIS